MPYDIDDSYRSKSGLNYQTNVMFKYISDNRVNVSGNRVPIIFTIAVVLYRDDINEFRRRLWEGLFMSSENNKQAFLRFLTIRRPQLASDIFWSLEKAEEHLRKCGFLTGSMYDGISLDRIENYESIIMKDNNFIKRYKGMIRFLKMGFSVMKEYLIADSVSMQSKTDISGNQTRVNPNYITVGQSISNFVTKTETLENNSIESFSIPISFVYYNRTVDGFESWVDLYVKFMKILWAEKGRQLSTYMGRSFVNMQTVDIGNLNTSKKMIKPKRIADNVFIETNLACREIINRIKAVLDKTLIPVKRFVITYKIPISIDSVTESVNQNSKTTSGLESESTSISDSITNKGKSFKKWLVEEEHLSTGTATVYITSLNIMEKMAESSQLTSSRLISAESYVEAYKTCQYLYKSKDFLSLNINTQREYKSALQKLLKYLKTNSSVAIVPEEEKSVKFTVVSSDNTDIREQIVDFTKYQDYAYTKPTRFHYDGICISAIKSWTDLYTELFTFLWKKHTSELEAYIGKNFVGGNRIDLGTGEMRAKMTAPKMIKNNYVDDVYIETNLSAKDIISRIKSILEICYISLEDVEIKYVKRDNAAQRALDSKKTLSTNKPITSLGNGFIDWLIRDVGLTERTSKNYYGTIVRAERLARDENLRSQRIITADSYNEATVTYKELLENDRFLDLNASSHNSFTAAINKYLKYIQIGSPVSQSTASKYDKELVEHCLTLIREKFTNGVKRGSVIAEKKFRSAYAEKYGTSIPDWIDLDGLLSQNTLEYSGKFYCVNTELTDFIRKLLVNYPTESDMAFFYSVFYEKNMNALTQLGVYSEEMLKVVLKREFPDYHYKTNYFTTRRGLTLVQVVNTAYRADVCLSLDELQERLPYVDGEKMLSILSRGDSGFVRIADGKYVMESRMYIVQSDVEQSRQIIENDIRTQGYSFITRIIVEESEYKNPEINKSALQHVLFDYYLANDFSKNQTLIAPPGKADSVLNILKNYCKQHRRITLEEVEEYEKELTGEKTARRSLNAAVSSMIRVGEDTFAERVDFDVAAVDKVIESFIYGKKIISLANVTSFSAFPDVEEYAWNSCLLASYLRRYSQQWGYIGEEHEKKSIGAIFDKALTFESYDDAIAKAVASSGVELTQEEVSYFLLHNEYRLRNKDFKDIISKAYQIRMREE